MRLDRKFRFVKKQLNDLLIAALVEADFDYAVDQWGYVYYLSQDTEAFEDVLAEVRSSLFKSWQVLSCPQDTLESYRSAMRGLRVRFAEEVNDDRVEFLIPGDVDPHSWPLESTTSSTDRIRSPSRGRRGRSPV
jgi:hypothetical protein